MPPTPAAPSILQPTPPATSAAVGSDLPVTVVRDTPNYRVTYYRRSATKLVIVFISAGQSAPGEPVEEFKRTLDRFDTSILFVLDRHSHWFNYDESAPMWAELDAIAAGYAHVASMGESMGGCGALLANKELTRVHRTLAMAPQHSIVKPFVDFDVRYERVARMIPAHRYIHFSEVRDRSTCTVLFGNLEWRDYMHSAMFAAYGLDPVYVDGADHNVAAFLKAQPGNGLVRLVAALLDWTRPFSRQTVSELFPALVTTIGLQLDHSFAAQARAYNHDLMARLASESVAALCRPLGPNLALNCRADQSSLSAYSLGTTTQDDAGNAVSGPITGRYSFHTEREDMPWWMVDLGSSCELHEIRLFNYIAEAAIMVRSARIRIGLSMDGTNWAKAYERSDPAPFGGINGNPLVWRPPSGTRARFVRVEAVGPTYLHLDQVQIFGQASTEAA